MTENAIFAVRRKPSIIKLRPFGRIDQFFEYIREGELEILLLHN